MQINYIILAHKNPEQLKRMVQKLNESWIHFYIHIDKTTNIEPFKNGLKDLENVYFLNPAQRRVGTWGDFGVVLAIIDALKQIILDKRKGYTILMTGQDYPLQNNLEIRNFFIENSGTQFISVFPLPSETWEKGGLPRINHYRLSHSPERGDFSLFPSIFEKEFYTQSTARKINYLRKTGKLKFAFRLLKKRKFPSYLKPFGGGVYWAFSMHIINEILTFLEIHPDYLKYHKYTLLGDEVLFQSIIMHLKEKHSFHIAPSLTYVNWLPKTGPLPVTFTVDHFEELRIASREKLFARKFDIYTDENIMELIDSKLHK